MRVSVCLGMLAVALLAASCAVNPPDGKPIVTPDSTLEGRVIAVNPASRYLIANFPPGRPPAPGQPLHIYRNGLKVGEARVDARWRRDDNAAADIVAGEAQVGDAVKDR